MLYCSRSDIESKRIHAAHLLQLVDDDETGEFDNSTGATPPQGNTLPLYNDATSAINTRITACIADASAVIDGSLRPVYALPIAAPVPDLLKTLCVDIAAYYLYSRRNTPPDNVVKLFDSAMNILHRIEMSRIVLNLPAAAGNTSPQGAFAVKTRERVFTALEGVEP